MGTSKPTLSERAQSHLELLRVCSLGGGGGALSPPSPHLKFNPVPDFSSSTTCKTAMAYQAPPFLGVQSRDATK